MGKNVAMQIAAMSPAYLDEASVPAEVVEHEKSILAAQMKEDPKMASKPEAVLAKIAAGKMGKYYKENCLVNLSQPVKTHCFSGFLLFLRNLSLTLFYRKISSLFSSFCVKVA